MPGPKNSDDVGMRKTLSNQLRETVASTMSYDSENRHILIRSQIGT